MPVVLELTVPDEAVDEDCGREAQEPGHLLLLEALVAERCGGPLVVLNHRTIAIFYRIVAEGASPRPVRP